MSPEYGSTVAIFPIDDETIRYLRMTGRDGGAGRAGRGLRQGAGPLARPDGRAGLLRDASSSTSSTVVPSHRRAEAAAGPGRAHRREGRLPRRRSATTPTDDGARSRRSTRRSAESFPASDPPAVGTTGNGAAGAAARRARRTRRRGRPVEPGHGHACDGTEFEVDHGARRHRGDHLVHQHVQPVGDDRRRAAGQEGRRARASTRKPWVKTTLAPGSKVVMDYYERAGLTPYLDKLGFNLVGYGCTTCIGNSGPLPEPISEAVNDNDLAVVSVLSGNRNFEGRINPDVKMNYLTSPPLVVAYALAGSMDIDLTTEPLGQGHRRQPTSSCGHLAVQPGDPGGRRLGGRARRCSAATTPTCSPATSAGRSLPTPTGNTFEWDPDSTYVRKPPYFDGMPRRAGAGHRHRGRPGARRARRLGDHRPHLAGRLDQGRLARPGDYLQRARRRPARLQLLRLAPRQPRGDDPRHLREHPAAQPARARAPRAASPATSPPAARSPRSTTRRSTTPRPARRW